MKMIGDRVSYKEHDDCTTVIISTKIDKWKETLLLTWLLGWTACGVGFVYFLFWGGFAKEERLALLIMTIFWLFFELRIGKAFLWRKFGQEFIKIDRDLMTIKTSIMRYGKAVPYQLGRIKQVRALEMSHRNFFKNMNDSFWVIGQGTVAFKYNDKEIRFGTQLSPKESEELAKVVKKLVQKYNKQGKEVLQVNQS